MRMAAGSSFLEALAGSVPLSLHEHKSDSNRINRRAGGVMSGATSKAVTRVVALY